MQEVQSSEGYQEQTIPHFLICIETQQYRKSCCCGKFNLRTAIYIWAILDLVLCGIDLLLSFFTTEPLEDKKSLKFLMFLNYAYGIIVPLIGIFGVSSTNVKRVKIYYFASLVFFVIWLSISVFQTFVEYQNKRDVGVGDVLQNSV